MIYLGEWDPKQQQNYRQLLQRWPICLFDDGQVLYQELQREPPRLLILNLLLPGMDPFLMVRLLKFDSRFASMPILCLIPYQEPGLPDRLHRLGARGWLAPDSDSQLLLEAVETLLGEAQASPLRLELPGLTTRAANRKTSSPRRSLLPDTPEERRSFGLHLA
ncbi:MAG: response regulator transcription factor [Candidatus Eremiobacteraeota bacterium]|nr:response regulator transcription factor [Candidatus Eremiobacteraeota bacterium]MCW5872939.1 response regulator transcription factor [Candidatus Eremiobacteraeota bacterium]